MRSTAIVLSIAMSALVLCAACGAGPDGEEPAFPADHRSWKKPVEKVLDYPVPGHGAGARIIYGNAASFDPIVTREKGRITRVEMRDGAMVVKEVYASRKDALLGGEKPAYTVIDVMYKNGAHPEAQGGWLYYIYKPGGKMVRIKGRMCVECHVAANESHPYFDKNADGIFRDYLFAPFAEAGRITAGPAPAKKNKRGK